MFCSVDEETEVVRTLYNCLEMARVRTEARPLFFPILMFFVSLNIRNLIPKFIGYLEMVPLGGN